MRIGLCTNMNTNDPADLGLDQIGYCKEIGIDYMELSLDRIMLLDDDTFASLRGQLDAEGMPCLACNNFIPPSVRLLGKAYNRERFEGYIRKAVTRAAALGARKIVFGSAGARTVPSDFPLEAARAQMVERLTFIADIAARHGVEIEVEHLNRLECNIINTFEESVALAKQLASPNVKSIFDSYHFTLGNEDEALIARHGAWIGHMHFACALGRHMPDIHDVRTLAPLLQKLKACAYDDTFSIEAYFPGRLMTDRSFAKVVEALKTALG